jgi:pyruvate/2-oxoglutarate dehydrogenase complex dihydrolipoamide acyltransferase (E2) component
LSKTPTKEYFGHPAYIEDLAARAFKKPAEEVQEGHSQTNPGVFGGCWPAGDQPTNVGIVDWGRSKASVVISSIAIRSMCYVTLSAIPRRRWAIAHQFLHR